MKYRLPQCDWCRRTFGPSDKYKWISPGERWCDDWSACEVKRWEDSWAYYDRSKPSTEEILWPTLD